MAVLERETGFEPATPTLARLCSTPELLPQRIKILSLGISLSMLWKFAVSLLPAFSELKNSQAGNLAHEQSSAMSMSPRALCVKKHQGSETQRPAAQRKNRHLKVLILFLNNSDSCRPPCFFLDSAAGAVIAFCGVDIIPGSRHAGYLRNTTRLRGTVTPSSWSGWNTQDH